MSRVAVILTTYNRPKTLKRAIDSALNQTEDIDLYIMDDNSYDREHLSILREYYAHPKVYLYKSNVEHVERADKCRFSVQINTAIELAKDHYKYFSYLIDDDYYLPDRCKRMADFLDANQDVHMVVGDQITNKLNEDGSESPENPQHPIRHQTGIIHNPHCNIDHNSFMHRAFILHEGIRWPTERIHYGDADGVFLQRCADRGWYCHALGGDPTDVHVKNDLSWNATKVWDKLEEEKKNSQPRDREPYLLFVNDNSYDELKSYLDVIPKFDPFKGNAILIDYLPSHSKSIDLLFDNYNLPGLQIYKTRRKSNNVDYLKDKC